jgi:hypothetical protein
MFDPDTTAAATSSAHEGDRPSEHKGSILDALDFLGVGEVNIAFERTPSYPRPATFD